MLHFAHVDLYMRFATETDFFAAACLRYSHDLSDEVLSSRLICHLMFVDPDRVNLRQVLNAFTAVEIPADVGGSLILELRHVYHDEDQVIHWSVDLDTIVIDRYYKVLGSFYAGAQPDGRAFICSAECDEKCTNWCRGGHAKSTTSFSFAKMLLNYRKDYLESIQCPINHVYVDPNDPRCLPCKCPETRETVKLVGIKLRPEEACDRFLLRVVSMAIAVLAERHWGIIADPRAAAVGCKADNSWVPMSIHAAVTRALRDASVAGLTVDSYSLIVTLRVHFSPEQLGPSVEYNFKGWQLVDPLVNKAGVVLGFLVPGVDRGRFRVCLSGRNGCTDLCCRVFREKDGYARPVFVMPTIMRPLGVEAICDKPYVVCVEDVTVVCDQFSMCIIEPFWDWVGKKLLEVTANLAAVSDEHKSVVGTRVEQRIGASTSSAGNTPARGLWSLGACLAEEKCAERSKPSTRLSAVRPPAHQPRSHVNRLVPPDSDQPGSRPSVRFQDDDDEVSGQSVIAARQQELNNLRSVSAAAGSASLPPVDDGDAFSVIDVSEQYVAPVSLVNEAEEGQPPRPSTAEKKNARRADLRAVINARKAFRLRPTIGQFINGCRMFDTEVKTVYAKLSVHCICGPCCVVPVKVALDAVVYDGDRVLGIVAAGDKVCTGDRFCACFFQCDAGCMRHESKDAHVGFYLSKLLDVNVEAKYPLLVDRVYTVCLDSVSVSLNSDAEYSDCQIFAECGDEIFSRLLKLIAPASVLGKRAGEELHGSDEKRRE